MSTSPLSMSSRPSKNRWCFLALVAFCCTLLGACSDGGSSSNSASSPTDTTNTAATPLDPQVLESAASFLGAATGKEVPLTVEHVVFVNSVLGLNEVDRTPSCLYGDLWVIERDEYGVPVLDEQGCIQPIPTEPIPVLDDFGEPTGEYLEHVPMFVEEFRDGEVKCSVVEGYEEYPQEFVIERLNMVRSNSKNPEMMAMALAEAIRNINESVAVDADLAGRLVLEKIETVVDPDTGLANEITISSTIDSPRENLALYNALLREGRIAGYGPETISEEGERIPAPWLEIRADLEMGKFAYLRDGTAGRNRGIGLHNAFADFSGVSHSSAREYSGRMVDYVQYQSPDDNGCLYRDQRDDAWLRVYGGEERADSNIRAFATHADDARRMIDFMHRVIQDAPDDGIIADLPAHLRVEDESHAAIPEAAETPIRHLQLETAAAMLAAAAGKEVPLSRDAIMFVNSALGINDLPVDYMGEFFGDLWVILRDPNGVPITATIVNEELDEELQCPQPIASEPIPVLDEFGDATGEYLDYVPMMIEEYMDGKLKCAVVPGYEDYVQEVEMGRLNCVRTALSNPEVLNKQWVEAVKTLNSAITIKRDLAGRLVYTIEYLDEAGELQRQDKAIDSPLQNLGLYRALMTSGTLEGDVVIKVEGTPTLVEVRLNPDLLTENGLEYLIFGDEVTLPPAPVLPIMASGYADFSGFSHSDAADYAGVPVDYVQWHDPAEPGFTCTYTDETADIHLRILNGDEEQVSQLDAFLRQAEASRETNLFNHRVIQNRP